MSLHDQNVYLILDSLRVLHSSPEESEKSPVTKSKVALGHFLVSLSLPIRRKKKQRGREREGEGDGERERDRGLQGQQ